MNHNTDRGELGKHFSHLPIHTHMTARAQTLCHSGRKAGTQGGSELTQRHTAILVLIQVQDPSTSGLPGLGASWGKLP